MTKEAHWQVQNVDAVYEPSNPVSLNKLSNGRVGWGEKGRGVGQLAGLGTRG